MIVSDSFSDFLCVTEKVTWPLGPCAHCSDLGRALYSSTEQQLWFCSIKVYLQTLKQRDKNNPTNLHQAAEVEPQNWEPCVCNENKSILVIDADAPALGLRPGPGQAMNIRQYHLFIYLFSKAAVAVGSSFEAFFSILEENACRCCLCLYSVAS